MLFYTGTTLAAAMYIVGAVEIALVCGRSSIDERLFIPPAPDTVSGGCVNNSPALLVVGDKKGNSTSISRFADLHSPLDVHFRGLYEGRLNNVQQLPGLRNDSPLHHG